MNRTIVMLPLTLLLSGRAWAADIDVVAPNVGVETAAPENPSDAEARARSNGRGRVVHPTPGKPGRVVVHKTPNRPGRTVVHQSPNRSSRAVTHRPAPPPRVAPAPARPPVVVHPAPVVTYRYVRPYHGVVVYGPRPVTHVHYVHGPPGPVQVAVTDLPTRAVDRNQSFAIGLKGGSLISGSNNGYVYGDPGLGLVARYRPAETIGLELGVTHHATGLQASRAQTQVAPSVELFAYPWTRVSPYLIGGVTFNRQVVTDNLGLSVLADGQTGLHAGLGLELAMGRTAALDLEGRYIGWVSESLVNDAPGALQATAGLMFHF